MRMGCRRDATCEMSLFLSKQERRVGEPFSQDQPCARRAWNRSWRSVTDHFPGVVQTGSSSNSRVLFSTMESHPSLF